MIKFYNDNGDVATANGRVKIIPILRGYTTTTSTNGVMKRSYVRNVNKYEVTIDRMVLSDYNILKLMFLQDLHFKDIDRNIEDGNLFIDGTEFSLEEVENKIDNTFYYTGTFTLIKS